MNKCSICKIEIQGNAYSEKIITCPRCVQKLLVASKEVKIQARDSFVFRNDLEAARSIESFIVEEGGTDIATLKTSRHLRQFRPSVNVFKSRVATVKN
jgi:DNA-directed RNA polymerase subunit RPC12/RpoP